MTLRSLPSVRVREKYVPFSGGLDTATPPLAVKPGRVRDSLNFFQELEGGYRSVQGYERFDGQARPSDATYSKLTCTITGSVAVGDVLTDAAVTGYGTVIVINADYVVLTKVTGTFATGNIKVGAAVVGTCTGPQVENAATTPKLRSYWLNLAAEEYRGDITAVPGSGNLLGGFFYVGVYYAFRNNVGGTAADLYKSSAAGWVQVALGRELRFTCGWAYEPQEGDVITGAVSGETATLTRVVLESGTWAGGDAAGRFIFASQSGSFQAETLNVGAHANVATIAGDSSAITLSPNGKVRSVQGNFTSSLDTRRVYGCDGVNRGFEFDGTVFVPIETGMITDTPEFVAIHQNRLFFTFRGVVQFSAVNLPYEWSVVVGSGEYGVGDQITGIEVFPGDLVSHTLAITTRNATFMLYGSEVVDWTLVAFKEGDAGAYTDSLQFLGSALILDDRGVTSLRAAQEYGNFKGGVFSDHIKSWITYRKTSFNASCVIKDKGLYCLFYSDLYGLYVTVANGKPVAMMPVRFPDEVLFADSFEDTDGSEAVFFGSDDGVVYQMQKGTSFDGDKIEANLSLAYNHLGSPNTEKKFRGCLLEVSGEGYYEFSFSYKVEYASRFSAQAAPSTITADLAPARWDEFVWDAFVWDSARLAPIRARLSGVGSNIALKIVSRGDYFSDVLFPGVLLYYSANRQLR